MLRRMTRDEAIYVAGLFDGEGYVNVSESKQRKRSDATVRPLFMFTVGITNTNLFILEWLSEFGGTVHRKSRAKAHWTPAFEWRITGNKATFFLSQIAPFLRIKQDIVTQALIYRKKWGHWTTKRYSDDQLTERRADREKVICLVNRPRKQG